MTDRLFAVIVTYRRPAALADAVREVAAPQHDVTHLVVVDNAGDPATDAVVAEAAGSLPVTVIRSPVNLGPAGGLASGLDHVLALASDDDWVALLDDDNVRPVEITLAGLRDFARAQRAVDPATAAVGASGMRLDRRRGLVVRPPDGELHDAVPVDAVGGNQLAVVGVGAVRHAGTFRRDLFFGFDDLEFGLRLQEAGFHLYAHGASWHERRRRFGRLGVAPPPAERDEAPWRRYYAVRNLIVILRAHGCRGAALRMTAASLFARPFVDWRRQREWRRLTRYGWRGVADAWLGRMGRRVEPA